MSALTLKVTEFKTIWKQEGLRALYRRYGWKLLAGLFAYYLVRDLTLYVLLPVLLVRTLG